MDKPTAYPSNKDLLDITQESRINTEITNNASHLLPESPTPSNISASSSTTTSPPSSPRIIPQSTPDPISPSSKVNNDRNAFTLPLLKFIGRSAKTLLFTFLFDWTQIIRHPIGSLTTLIVYPLASGLMVVVSVGFRIASRFKHDQTEHPKMFDEVKQELVDTAGSFLQTSFGLKYDKITKITHHEDYADARYIRPSFSIDIAEFMLILSALIYERDEAPGGVYPSKATTPDQYTSYIHSQAQKWGLEFKSLSELGTNASPFCGAFYDRNKKFIVIAFKGTTPTEFADWIVDVSFMRTDGRTQLFGEVHEGFYRMLFGKEKKGRSKLIESYSYRNILKNLIDIINDIKSVKGSETSINVWVTGHSLGSALATLFYARLMRSPADLPDDCILRDAYIYGTPCIGNGEFAINFSSLCNTPSNRFNTCWRIIDDKDIVCNVPVGFDNPEIMQYLSDNYIFDYAHVGEAIRLFQDGRRPKTEVDGLLLDEPEKKAEENKSSNEEEDKTNRFVPPFIKDHFTSGYLRALQLARPYFPSTNTTRALYEERQPVPNSLTNDQVDSDVKNVVSS
ncbi:3786_t:CDS:2 [Paraglomus occultum]|uniref:3786_t:CDS:1 n=1 Tax=Paraglomus occultum TaxID=144539 RepID=A0A9N9BSH6_9GLOM|nr:3786_t:CDS:2 [Paraglomus occultum]